jgi:hypothetical protein
MRAELFVGFGDGGAAVLLDEGEDSGQHDHEEQRDLEKSNKFVDVRVFD